MVACRLDPQRWLYTKTHYDQIKDFSKYPELRWINRNHLVPPILLGVGTFLAFGWVGFFWGFVLSTVLLWHGTFTINSLSHVFGNRRYETTDTSRNNGILAIITLGEGWHNNHHAYQSATRQGFFWWEYDITYYGLKALSWIGVVKDIRQPPLEQLESRRLREKLKLRVILGGRMTPPKSIAREKQASV